MSETSSRNLHVPLPGPLYRRLREEAARRGQPATQLAREAIDRWLAEARRAAVHQAIAVYARENAGTRNDLDPELEAASVEHLLESATGAASRRARRKSRGSR